MNFQNLKLTANGKSMLAKVATGGQVIFTKIAFGSGTTSKDVTTLTELVTKKQEFTIASKVIGANGLLTLSCVWNNKDLTTGYYVNELGIYAKPSSSASEVLFAYGTDDSPSFIPEYGGSNVTSGIMKINLIYSSDANVTVRLEYGDKIVEVHNTDPDAHAAIFAKYQKKLTFDSTPTNGSDNPVTSHGIFDALTQKLFTSDLHRGIMASLASKTLVTVVNAITTDSVLGKLIKMLLNDSGVKYLIANNGYVCFGEFLGGLIIQWGNNITVTGNGYGASMEYPITFPNKALAVIPYDVNGGWTDSAIPSVHAAWFPEEGSDNDGNDRRWARVGFSEKSSLFGAYRYIVIGH